MPVLEVGFSNGKSGDGEYEGKRKGKGKGQKGRTPFDVQSRNLEPDGRAGGRGSPCLSHCLFVFLFDG